MKRIIGFAVAAMHGASFGASTVVWPPMPAVVERCEVECLTPRDYDPPPGECRPAFLYWSCLDSQAKDVMVAATDAGLAAACDRGGDGKFMLPGMPTNLRDVDCRRLAKEATARRQQQRQEDAGKREADIARRSAAATDEAAAKARHAGLVSGAIKPSGFREFLVATGAPDGNSIARRPMVKPDHRVYGFSGRIEAPVDGQAEFVGAVQDEVSDLSAIGVATGERVAAALLSATVGARFWAVVPSQLEGAYYASARIGTRWLMLGRYVANRSVALAGGSSMVIPVFEVIELRRAD